MALFRHLIVSHCPAAFTTISVDSAREALEALERAIGCAERTTFACG